MLNSYYASLAFIHTRQFFHKVTKTSERIDIEKLRAREQIMFFDDVLLFEDELHDHGVSMISVKIVSPVQISTEQCHFFKRSACLAAPGKKSS